LCVKAACNVIENRNADSFLSLLTNLNESFTKIIFRKQKNIKNEKHKGQFYKEILIHNIINYAMHVGFSAEYR